ncbi:hypothetical protein GCM10010510_61530 [Streptomyces anandii JCM 4720]|nr:hypothetical protein GCM10010510_61530 [Streptomyces anandii JCM 4720]
MKYLVYGMKSTAVEEAVVAISNALQVTFELRESSYKGGQYFRYRDNGGWDVSIESHWQDEDGLLAKPDFSEYSVLIYVNEVPLEVEGKFDRIPSIRKLESRVF